MATIPLIFNRPVSVDLFVQNNIEAKKYYYPLDLTCTYSSNLFNNIICLPLNTDITFVNIDFYIDIIKQLVE